MNVSWVKNGKVRKLHFTFTRVLSLPVTEREENSRRKDFLFFIFTLIPAELCVFERKREEERKKLDSSIHDVPLNVDL